MMSSAHAELEAYVNSLTQQILPALDKIEDIHKILTKYKQTKVNSKLYKYWQQASNGQLVHILAKVERMSQSDVTDLTVYPPFQSVVRSTSTASTVQATDPILPQTKATVSISTSMCGSSASDTNLAPASGNDGMTMYMRI